MWRQLAGREKKTSSKPPRKNSDTCNLKNGWYYSTAVNVHGESFGSQWKDLISRRGWQASTAKLFNAIDWQSHASFPAHNHLRRASVLWVWGEVRARGNWS